VDAANGLSEVIAFHKLELVSTSLAGYCGLLAWQSRYVAMTAGDLT
jgi:hypothetical protein